MREFKNKNFINYSFLAGSGVGVRLDDGEPATVSKADKIAESRGFRGAVGMPEGGGKDTGSGEGMTGVVALWIGGVSRLRCASGGKEVDILYS